MHQYQIIECQACGSTNARIEEEPKYHGLRGRCPDCGGDWPES